MKTGWLLLALLIVGTQAASGISPPDHSAQCAAMSAAAEQIDLKPKRWQQRDKVRAAYEGSGDLSTLMAPDDHGRFEAADTANGTVTARLWVLGEPITLASCDGTPSKNYYLHGRTASQNEITQIATIAPIEHASQIFPSILVGAAPPSTIRKLADLPFVYQIEISSPLVIFDLMPDPDLDPRPMA